MTMLSAMLYVIITLYFSIAFPISRLLVTGMLKHFSIMEWVQRKSNLVSSSVLAAVNSRREVLMQSSIVDMFWQLSHSAMPVKEPKLTYAKVNIKTY